MGRIRRAGSAVTPLSVLLSEYGGHRKMLKQIGARQDDLKAEIMDVLADSGVPDDKGSLWLEFDEPMGGFDSIKRERRCSVLLDTVAAEEKLREIDLWERCTTVDITVDTADLEAVLTALEDAGLSDLVMAGSPRINEDKIMAVYYEGKHDPQLSLLSDDDLQEIFVEKVTYALVVKEAG